VKEREVVEGEEEKESINLFAYLLPGMLAIGLLFVAQISMRDMVRERESGHLGRLLSTPTSIVSIITSKLVSTIILLVLCHILLAVVSTFLFGIRWSNLPASFLLVLAEGIAITGLLALLFSITTTERQGDALSSVVILGMSLIGGSMVPLDMFPEGMQSFGRLTLNYYAIEGFRQVLVWEGGLGAVLRPLAILTLFGLVTTAIAAILLPRNLRRRG
jgi:ABC-2 type transport system permease protein